MQTSRRTYILQNNVDVSTNFNVAIKQLDLTQHKPIKKYKVLKQKYLNINRTIINEKTHTYAEYFTIIDNSNNTLVIQHDLITLDNLEFPQLHKYDFNDTYDEYEYLINERKVISNKYETYYVD